MAVVALLSAALHLPLVASASLEWSPPTHYRITTRTVSTVPSLGFFTRAVGLDFDNAVLLNGENSTVASTDDTPLDLVELPFPFSYFGERKLSIWINPNGGVQFDAKHACGCCFSARDCDYNTSYFDIIAGAMTDLIPVKINESIVRYAHLDDGNQDPGFGIAFVGIPVFGAAPSPGPLYSFAIVLRKSGRISVAYEKIFDTRVSIPGYRFSYHVTDSWLVGLRPPLNYALSLEGLGADSFCSKRKDYGTSLCGSYPSADLIVPGTVVEYCPTPTTICVEPSWAVSGIETKIRIKGSSQFACTSKNDSAHLALYCRFGNHPNTTRAETINKTHSRELECTTPPDFAGAPALLGSVKFDLVYYSGSGSMVALPMRSNNYFVFESNSSTPPPQTCNSSARNSQSSCSVCGECVQESSSTSIANDTSVCAANTCDGNIDSQLDCSGVCEGPAIYGADGRCCPSASLLDCEGICNGTSISAIVNYGMIVAQGCCPRKSVDCAGVCSGKASFDRCGICSGGTTGRQPNAGLDCLGLCPDDPRRNIPGVDSSCSPIVRVEPTDIEFLVNHNAKREELARKFAVRINNMSPISVYLLDFKILNQYASPSENVGLTSPDVRIEQNLTAVSWSEELTYEVPSQTIIHVNVSIDMRLAFDRTSLNTVPLREKKLFFQYTYGGPKATVFDVVVPIKVSLFC